MLNMTLNLVNILKFKFKTDIEELKIEELNQIIDQLKRLGNKEEDIKIVEKLKNRIENIYSTYIYI